MNQKDVLMTIECKPDDIRGCINRLEEARKQFGDVDNLVLSMNATGDFEAAKKELYLSLVNNGWTKDQIYAMCGAAAAGSRPGGNLAKLMPGSEGR